MDESIEKGSSAQPRHNGEAGNEQAGIRHVLALLVTAVVFYLARSILIPLAIASILTVILSPVAERLERLVGRTLTATLLVLLSVAMVGGATYFFTAELTGVANEVSGYSENIALKIRALKNIAPSSLGKLEQLAQSIRKELEGPATRTHVPVVQTLPPPKSWTEQLSPTLPVLGGLFQLFMVVVLMFFLLYDRRSLRDRLVRLAARARIPVATRALDEAAERVSRYLLLYSLINFGFGLAVGLLCWAVGLERPVLWGTLAFLLRYVPYIGAITGAVLPTLVALAVFPGWWPALIIVGIYTGIDQFTAEFIEPIVIGKGVGVSPVALLTSAIFWAWLWGPVGLVLSTPFTVCLKVAGDHIPSLGFFSILFGEDVPLEGHHDYYRRLLEMDLVPAREGVVRYCDLHGIEQTFSDLMWPALMLAQSEFALGNINGNNHEFILEQMRELATELGERFAKPQAAPRMRLLGVWAPGDPAPVGLVMVIQMLKLKGFAAGFPPPDASADAICRYAALYGPDLVCAAWPTRERLAASAELVRALLSEAPGIAIVGFGPCTAEERSQLEQDGCLQVCTELDEALQAVLAFASRRERERRREHAGVVTAARG